MVNTIILFPLSLCFYVFLPSIICRSGWHLWQWEYRPTTGLDPEFEKGSDALSDYTGAGYGTPHPGHRHGHAVASSTSHIFLFGGFAKPAGVKGDLWSYDPNLYVWQFIDTTVSTGDQTVLDIPGALGGGESYPGARKEHCLQSLSDGRVRLFAGIGFPVGGGGEGIMADVWEFDEVTEKWTFRDVAPGHETLSSYVDQIASPPFYPAGTEYPCTFAVGLDFYTCGGFQKTCDRIWRFDDSLGNWTFIDSTGMTTPTTPTMCWLSPSNVGVVADAVQPTRLYIAEGGDLYTFSFDTTEWTRKDLPGGPVPYSSRDYVSPGVTIPGSSISLVFGGYGSGKRQDLNWFDGEVRSYPSLQRNGYDWEPDRMPWYIDVFAGGLHPGGRINHAWAVWRSKTRTQEPYSLFLFFGRVHLGMAQDVWELKIPMDWYDFGTICQDGYMSSNRDYVCGGHGACVCTNIPCYGPCYCDPGYYLLGEGMTCELCPVQYFCEGGYSAPTFCPAAYFCPTLGLDAPRTCTNGSYCHDSGRIAPIGCGAGTFCPEGSLLPIPCPVGYICPSPFMNEPVACSAGSFCPAERLESAVACPEGRFCPERCSSPEICPVGHFCPNETATPIKCSGGFVCSMEGLATPDIVCAIGYHCPPESVEMIACTSEEECPFSGMTFSCDKTEDRCLSNPVSASLAMANKAVTVGVPVASALMGILVVFVIVQTVLCIAFCACRRRHRKHRIEPLRIEAIVPEVETKEKIENEDVICTRLDSTTADGEKTTTLQMSLKPGSLKGHITDDDIDKAVQVHVPDESELSELVIEVRGEEDTEESRNV